MHNAPDPLVERIAAEYGQDLLRYLARRVRTPADARDLAQEAYVRLLRLERKDLIRDPQPYLYRIAANLLHEFELKERAQLATLRRCTEEGTFDGDGLAIDREADSLGLATRLEEVLDELSPKCRAVLIMHRRDGMTYDEIGVRIGISSSMVKKYLTAGLRHCRARLRDFT
jgi:RNA polymerase sigma factor (sigma-70 family)